MISIGLLELHNFQICLNFKGPLLFVNNIAELLTTTEPLNTARQNAETTTTNKKLTDMIKWRGNLNVFITVQRN